MTVIFDPAPRQQEIVAEITDLRAGLARSPRVRLIGFDQTEPLKKVQAAAILKLHERFFTQQGIEVDSQLLGADASQAEVLRAVEEASKDDAVDGVTVLLPGPAELDLSVVVDAIDPAKEIEGLGWDNISRYLPGSPETPRLPLIVSEVIHSVLDGAPRPADREPRWVIVADREAMQDNLITQILAHVGPGLVWPRSADIRFIAADSPDLASACRHADYLLVAVEQHPSIIGADHVSQGAVVVDFSATVVGLAPTEAGGARPVFEGAVRSDEMDGLASLYCPAPRGCGPLLLAGLARNAVLASKNRQAHA